MGWQGWIAALGGLLVLIQLLFAPAATWLSWVGGIAALIFGLWGALAK